MQRNDIELRPAGPRLVVAAVAAAALLAFTLAVDLSPPESGVVRRAWLLATFILTAGLALLVGREVAARVSVDRALRRATQAMRELSVAADESLGDRTVSELLDELAARLRSLLKASWSSIALADESTGVLRVVTSHGNAPFAPGEERAIPSEEREGRAEQIAASLTLGDSRLGVVEVGAQAGSRFTRTDVELLRILADQLSTTIERAHLVDLGRRSQLGSLHARAHLSLLADISLVLSRALEDPRPALLESAEIIGTNLADSCAIHLAAADGALETVAAVRFDVPAAVSADELARRKPHAGETFRRVMTSGRSELGFVRSDGRIHGAEDGLAAGLRAAAMTSWVIAPIAVRGLSVGTITVATTAERRGLRPSDQGIVEELASRMSIVIERSLLYQDSIQAGLAAERRATQMAKLIEATISLSTSLQRMDVVGALVEQAVRVLDADHARAWLRTDSNEVTRGVHRADAVRIGNALVDAQGQGVGFLTVERDRSRPFDADDESVLLLLARLASVALQNAHLYDDVRVREQRLSALFAASPLAILELDLVGNVRAVNPAARELFDAANDEPVVLPIALRSLVAAQGRGAGVTDAETAVQVGDEVLSLWISTAPLVREGGTPAGVLMVVSDTTARKRLEVQLLEAHRYESIAKLAGGIAHDFNNLLTIILGYSDLLLRSDETPARVREEITAISEAGSLAAVITNQLLMLSRRQVLQPVVVPLKTATEALLPMLRRLVGARVTLDTRLSGESSVRIDHGQLEQVLFNLVLNSRDAMSGTGRIVIETTELPERDEITLSVSDTGHGMDAETIARCREPFFTTKGSRGIGLGLATVASIAEQSGGRFDVESEVGNGTRITVAFPRAVPAVEPEQHVWLDGQARVLLVDDDDVIRRYASHVLSEADYEVATAADAEEALLRLAGDERFDLLVSDVVLPAMNGFELARAAGAQRPGMARLLMSGFTGAETVGTDLADVAMLPKPFSVDELLAAVGKALGVAGQGSKR